MRPDTTRRRPLRPVLAVAALFLSGMALAQANDPSGIWVTQTGGSKVRITRCGAGYCGTLVSTGGGELDTNNPDPTLRTRKLVGMQILDARSPTGGGFDGTLYNPKDGKTYSGSLTLRDANHVEVEGCVLRVLCKRQTWTRVN